MSVSENIIPHNHKIAKLDRNAGNKHKSLVVWFAGLSGSGKSTVANALEQKLHEEGYKTYILDGDNIRVGLNKDLDFSESSRKENIRRIGEVSKLMADAGLIVLSAFISPFKSDRQTVRDILDDGEFLEVFVNCPLEVCEQRDVKGLYKKARNGEIKNFTGIDSPFEAPDQPDVEVKTNEEELQISVDKVFNKIIERVK